MPNHTMPKPRALRRVAKIILEVCEKFKAEKNLSQAVFSRHPDTVTNYSLALTELKQASQELDNVIKRLENVLGK